MADLKVHRVLSTYYVCTVGIINSMVLTTMFQRERFSSTHPSQLQVESATTKHSEHLNLVMSIC